MFLPSPRRVSPAQALRLPILALMVLLLVLLGSRMPLPKSITAVPLPTVDFGTLPLAFTPNHGQHDPAVRFQAGALGGTLFFSPDAVTLALPTTKDGGSQIEDRGSRSEQAKPRARSGHPLSSILYPLSSRFVLKGQTRSPCSPAWSSCPAPSTTSWATRPAGAVIYRPTLGVVYQRLYDGVDLHYDGLEGALKGTYIVAPGADPSRIRWRYEGAQSLRIDGSSGDLLLDLPGTSAPSRFLGWTPAGARSEGRSPRSPGRTSVGGACRWRCATISPAMAR